MSPEQLDVQFSLFLESTAYDRAQDALLSIVRAAFLAGYAVAKEEKQF